MLIDSVKILPLGGVGEIGKNCIVVEAGLDIIVVDTGLQFPSDDMPGVDLVIPDIGYLRERSHLVRAIFITHGHEDHIGALPYIVPELDVPIYATRLTAGLISVKLREHRLIDDVTLRIMAPGDQIEAGCFTVEPFAVTHSIPDGVGLAIHTPIGTIVHSGDFKFDPTPAYGPPVDTESLARLGERGVLALLSDCVRVENPGRTPSERIISDAFDAIVSEKTGRVIIATFASNISRIQQAIDVAERRGRKAAVVGRSMAQNCSVAADLGFLKPGDTLIRIEDALKLPAHQVMLITTGSQGEPSSALSRIASNEHRQIKIEDGDTVIISATAIPGNEETVAHTIDNLFRLGAEVIYEPLSTVHVSGHASQEELQDLIRLLKPRHCVPIHGEYRHMTLYRRLAIEAGIPADSVHLIEVGDVLAFGADYVERAGHIPVSSVLVDGVTVGATTDVVLRDRHHLSRDGVVIAVVTLDRLTGELLTEPEVVARGLPRSLTEGDIAESARERIVDVLSHGAAGEIQHGFLTQKIREALNEHIYRQLRCHPMILPVITGV